MKSSQRRHEDDLLTPAQAINPNGDLEPMVTMQPKSAGGGRGVDGRGGDARGGDGGAAGSKKRGKKEKGRQMDMSHLLGFSVASSERVNAGELDLGN
jgi:hypothetical protein